MQFTSSLRSGLRSGLVMGIVSIFIALIGMLQAFSKRFMFGQVSFTVIILLGLGLATGYVAIRQLKIGEGRASQRIVAGVAAGLVNGVMMAILLLIVAQFDLRSVLVNDTPELVEELSFGQSVTIGCIILVVQFTCMGLLAVLLGLIPERVRSSVLRGVTAVLVVGLFWEVLTKLDITRVFLDAVGWKLGKVLSPVGAAIIFIGVGAITYFWPNIRRFQQSRAEAITPERQRIISVVQILVLILVLIALPQAVGLFWSQTLTTIGLFTLMGLGLNIVVGLAGLLDLGYVAFYAIGAYTMALLSSPASSLGIAWPFWIVLPIAMATAATGGILLGIPVLRLRGDYLAIVTLGFGEIIRVLLNSDMLKPILGGPQGILETPAPVFFGIELNDPRYLYYLLLAACIVVIFLSTRLNHSRIGRAWIAMREDEDVAQAMGVNLVLAKLMAFSIGAAFAGVGGAIFAARQGAIFPADFTIFVSINVLCLIIIGGIGSTPGVLVGALFLIGLPEVLREVDEYRILAYGAGLVVMMIVKPEGLLPSARRRMELHQADLVEGVSPTSSESTA